ncbi:MAG: hypothetical protein U1F33_17825 [Alphaproteobacteria bacterium]
MSRRRRSTLCLRAASAVVLVAGCTGTTHERTAAYDIGYWDGCNTGYSQAGRPGYEASARKDVQRFASDEQYRLGWEKGDRECYDKELRFPTLTFGVWSR